MSDANVFGLNTCADGKTLLFSWIGQGSGQSINVWRTDANGADPKQLSFGRNDINPVCSMDSKQVYYFEVDGNLMHVPVDGSSKPEVVPGTVIPHAIAGGVNIGLSPDGKLLTFVSSTTEPGGKSSVQRIVLVPLDAGATPQVRFIEPNARMSVGPRFTGDGKALVYPIRVNGVDNLWLQPLDNSAGRQITNFPADRIGSFQWSLDGKTLGMTRYHTETDVVIMRDAGAAQ